MKTNHKLRLYVSYNPSRSDEKAYQMLSFGNQGETYKKIEENISVNPNAVKKLEKLI